RLFVEEQVMVSEVWPGDIPVEVFCLQVESEHVREQNTEQSCAGTSGADGDSILAAPDPVDHQLHVGSTPCLAILIGRGPPPEASPGRRDGGRERWNVAKCWVENRSHENPKAQINPSADAR